MGNATRPPHRVGAHHGSRPAIALGDLLEEVAPERVPVAGRPRARRTVTTCTDSAPPPTRGERDLDRRRSAGTTWRPGRPAEDRRHAWPDPHHDRQTERQRFGSDVAGVVVLGRADQDGAHAGVGHAAPRLMSTEGDATVPAAPADRTGSGHGGSPSMRTCRRAAGTDSVAVRKASLHQLDEGRLRRTADHQGRFVRGLVVIGGGRLVGLGKRDRLCRHPWRRSHRSSRPARGPSRRGT